MGRRCSWQGEAWGGEGKRDRSCCLCVCLCVCVCVCVCVFVCKGKQEFVTGVAACDHDVDVHAMSTQGKSSK